MARTRAAGRGRGGGVRPQRLARPHPYSGEKPIPRQTEDGYHRPGPDSPTHRRRYAHPTEAADAPQASPPAPPPKPQMRRRHPHVNPHRAAGIPT
ncbi:hypothetical protein GCM10009601_14890 [Streptomyces thermospinosisporus]|uniref:Uncharacterized protein n=1 Tax=Streptomyces thermospinosisporus TaxID=161482 RepID=A0ABN1YNN0_9ACTN